MVIGKPVYRFPPVAGFKNVSPVIEFIARHVDTTQAHKPTRLLWETMQNGDNYVKDGLLMLPERP